MDTHMLIEMIGYIGSTLVVVAMLMSSVVKLRVINSIGASIFAVYALLIQSYPTALMNVCLVTINMYNLAKLFKKTDNHYQLVEGNVEDTFLSYFLNYYKDDIHEFFPEFGFEKDGTKTVYYIYCDGNPAGILLGREDEEGAIDISIEYSTPMYRDCSVGKYLYQKLKEKGIPELSFREKAEAHESYLKKMGYVKSGEAYIRKL